MPKNTNRANGCVPDPDGGYIRSEISAGDQAVRKGLEHYHNAGERLTKKKQELGHGGWLHWLEAHGIKQQRASECIRLSEGWDKLPPGGNFTLKGALRVISTPAPAPKPAQPDGAGEYRGPVGWEFPRLHFSPAEWGELAPIAAGLTRLWEANSNTSMFAHLLRFAGQQLGDPLAALDRLPPATDPDGRPLPRQHHLTATAPAEWVQWLEDAGRYPEAADYDTVIDHNADVYKPDGTLLLSLRRRRVRQQVWSSVIDAAVKVSEVKNPEYGRKVAGRPVNSVTLGFVRGKLSPHTGRHRKQWELIRGLADALSLSAVPQGLRCRHSEVVRSLPTGCRIGGTQFTTLAVNHHSGELGRNARMPYHRDRGNAPGTLGAMSVCGKFEGGLLVFPKYRVAVNVRPHDLLVADNQELHGNTEISGWRLSVVAFVHETNLPQPETAAVGPESAH